MTTVAIVQARMSSSRFPGKMLAPLRGVPLAVFVCRRAAKASRVDRVVLATSDHPDDDPLAASVAAAGFAVFRGSRDDVLGRFVGAACAHGATSVVRITGDCALIDPVLLDEMLAVFAAGGADYLGNVRPPTYPDGLDLEIMSLATLERADREATAAHHREHVTPYLLANRRSFALRNHERSAKAGEDASRYLWSVDQPSDLQLVEDLIRATGSDDPRLPELLAAVERDEGLRARSTARRRNEGGARTFMAELERTCPRPVITRSNEIWARAEGLIPAGTQTLSKGPTQFVRGFAPKYLVRGQGSHVWDADGNEYIDYPMGLGPVTLGHGRPEVVAAVSRQVAEGNAFSLMHPLEVELSERIVKLVPCAEQVRFGRNGSDATAACVRAARMKTGRTAIARHGYHGWQDWAIESTYGIRAKGVPAEVMAMTSSFPYNDLEALETLLRARPTAGIIMEPCNLTPPKPGYLQGVRELATRYGAVLIFDEVVTGFRYARGGAQEHFGVIPDLCAMGKGIANGMPLALVAGKREFMAPFAEIFFSFTFAGETTALAAAMATLDVMEREDYWGHIWRQGRKIQDGYRALAREFDLDGFTDCQGLPPWTIVTFADTPRWQALQLKTLFQQEMIRRRILFTGSQLLSLAHSDEDIERTLAAYRAAMEVLRYAIDIHAVDSMTLGQVNEVIFRRG